MQRCCFVAVVAGLLALAACASGETAKEMYGEDIYWNATPNDVNNLLKSMGERVNANYSMQIKTLAEVSTDPEQNPVLYRTGHYNFRYAPAERQKLREYLLAGGMIIFNTGLGSAPFYRSAVRELKEILPEQPVQRLTSDHPIFHSYYDIDRVRYMPAVHKAGYAGNEPWIDGVEINCRVVALVSRWGMAVGWEGDVKEEHQAYDAESAYRLGMNIISYASAMRAWAKNTAQSMRFVDKGEVTGDNLSVVQVMYDGIWKTRHAGLSVLLQTFNQRTGVPVKFGLKEMRLSDPRIFDAPLLYMTGHEHFELGGQELASLRRYLENGGCLFAESCCGRKGFDLAFRKVLRRVMPEHRLQRIRPGAAIFKDPNDIKMLGVTPTLAADMGKAAVEPFLEGLEIEGHYAVIYSRFGLAGGWEMSQSPYARGYNEVEAIKLGQNILMYAVTQ